MAKRGREVMNRRRSHRFTEAIDSTVQVRGQAVVLVNRSGPCNVRFLNALLNIRIFRIDFLDFLELLAGKVKLAALQISAAKSFLERQVFGILVDHGFQNIEGGLRTVLRRKTF